MKTIIVLIMFMLLAGCEDLGGFGDWGHGEGNGWGHGEGNGWGHGGDD